MCSLLKYQIIESKMQQQEQQQTQFYGVENDLLDRVKLLTNQRIALRQTNMDLEKQTRRKVFAMKCIHLFRFPNILFWHIS